MLLLSIHLLQTLHLCRRQTLGVCEIQLGRQVLLRLLILLRRDTALLLLPPGYGRHAMVGELSEIGRCQRATLLALLLVHLLRLLLLLLVPELHRLRALLSS